MKITVVGTGYVGLVSGTCLAEVGNDVLCLDVDPEKIRILEEGGIPIYEPGLQDMVRRNVAAGRLRFTTDIEKAVQHGTIQFIAVGTPPDEDGSADLQYVLGAARNIGRLMTDYKVVVDKSTVPVGTGGDAIGPRRRWVLTVRLRCGDRVHGDPDRRPGDPVAWCAAALDRRDDGAPVGRVRLVVGGSVGSELSASQTDQQGDGMKVVVNYDLCESNAVCMGIAPEVFEVRDDDWGASSRNVPGNAGFNGTYAVTQYPEGGPDFAPDLLNYGYYYGIRRYPYTRDTSRKVGLVSIDFTARKDNAEVADLLATEYGVLTRCGLHCAPNAHKTYGTFPQGTVRFSFNSSNTEAEIDQTLLAIDQILV